MRIIVMFDLPVSTKKERSTATRFRNYLLTDGFFMMQFSVYGRICNGVDAVHAHIERLKLNTPEQGAIRVLTITEKQAEKMLLLLGKKTQPDMFEQLAFTLEF